MNKLKIVKSALWGAVLILSIGMIGGTFFILSKNEQKILFPVISNNFSWLYVKSLNHYRDIIKNDILPSEWKYALRLYSIIQSKVGVEKALVYIKKFPFFKHYLLVFPYEYSKNISNKKIENYNGVDIFEDTVDTLKFYFFIENFCLHVSPYIESIKFFIRETIWATNSEKISYDFCLNFKDINENLFFDWFNKICVSFTENGFVGKVFPSELSLLGLLENPLKYSQEDCVYQIADEIPLSSEDALILFPTKSMELYNGFIQVIQKKNKYNAYYNAVYKEKISCKCNPEKFLSTALGGCFSLFTLKGSKVLFLPGNPDTILNSPYILYYKKDEIKISDNYPSSIITLKKAIPISELTQGILPIDPLYLIKNNNGIFLLEKKDIIPYLIFDEKISTTIKNMPPLENYSLIYFSNLPFISNLYSKKDFYLTTMNKEGIIKLQKISHNVLSSMYIKEGFSPTSSFDFYQTHLGKKNLAIIELEHFKNENYIKFFNIQDTYITFGWDKKIPNKITSPIYTIDIYKNGKIQYLFTTNKEVYVIDALSRDVSGFPLKIQPNVKAKVKIFSDRFAIITDEFIEEILLNPLKRNKRYSLNFPLKDLFYVGNEQYIGVGAENVFIIGGLSQKSVFNVLPKNEKFIHVVSQNKSNNPLILYSYTPKVLKKRYLYLNIRKATKGLYWHVDKEIQILNQESIYIENIIPYNDSLLFIECRNENLLFSLSSEKVLAMLPKHLHLIGVLNDIVLLYDSIASKILGKKFDGDEIFSKSIPNMPPKFYINKDSTIWLGWKLYGYVILKEINLKEVKNFHQKDSLSL